MGVVLAAVDVVGVVSAAPMSVAAYYNEIDPYAAAWLRNLIAAGHIAPGDVDERSIADVRPSDLIGYTQCHFFAGIGVWSYSLRLAGWPDDRKVWTGSCPCQPFSAAGKGEGTDDARHLWPEWFRLIREYRPGIVFGEQVGAAIRHGWLDLVQADLEGLDYAVGAAVVGAHSVGAPHIRQRLWFVADASGTGTWRHAGDASSAPQKGHSEGSEHRGNFARGSLPCGATSELADSDGSRRGERWTGEAGDGAGSAREQLAGLRFAGELADPNGRDASAEGLQRGGQHGQQPQDSGADRLVGHAGDAGLPQRVGIGSVPGGVGGAAARETVERAGVHVDSAVEQSGGLGRQRGEASAQGHNDDRQASERAEGKHGLGLAGSHRSATAGFWRDADWLPCIDGKARPVEPGTFPLAHWAPARVGRLRAYGNAIVAPVAAEFVKAYMDCRP